MHFGRQENYGVDLNVLSEIVKGSCGSMREYMRDMIFLIAVLKRNFDQLPHAERIRNTTIQHVAGGERGRLTLGMPSTSNPRSAKTQ